MNFNALGLLLLEPSSALSFLRFRFCGSVSMPRSMRSTRGGSGPDQRRLIDMLLVTPGASLARSTLALFYFGSFLLWLVPREHWFWACRFNQSVPSG
jgi:hypothetical protein